MSLLTSFFLALTRPINLLLDAYIWIIIARALISWVNPDPHNPVLDRLRRFIPPIGGMDLTPIALILAIVFVQSFLSAMVQQAVGIR